MVAGFNKTTPATSSLGSSKIEDITSPHELTAYVEQLITQIEGKFDEMSTQILERMNQMSSRVDTLEASIQDLINSDGQPATGSAGQDAKPAAQGSSPHHASDQ